MLAQILSILEHSNIFLTGGGGVGKTYLTQAIIKYYRNELKNVIILGSTGISAVGLGGVSVHSFFKFGICKNYEELRSFDKKQRNKLSQLRAILDICDLLVIDEISMVSSDLMEMLRYRLNTSKFKGRILLVGDFYQLPPVFKSENNPNALFKFTYAFSSHAWSELGLTNVELLVSKRTRDIKFYEILSRLRVGILDDEVIEYISSLRVDKFETSEDDSVLFGRNLEVDKLNEERLNAINAPMETSVAQVNLMRENLHPNTVQSWINSLSAPLNLNMKIGTKIIFTTNKWGEYYNGEQGKIVQIIKKNGICESVIVQKDSGEISEITKNLYELGEFDIVGDEIEQNTLATFLQFPFKLAYALTIHKSQGMSINSLFCDLNHIFANGQLYVALSRAKDPARLKLFYNRSGDFRQYLRKVVKIDDEVFKFYKENKFENIKENF
ncbi:AAA family ATPase [Campylobacter sp. faydin G-105]|nr:AAA family ATPase [Campylobacter anatolicus]